MSSAGGDVHLKFRLWCCVRGLQLNVVYGKIFWTQRVTLKAIWVIPATMQSASSGSPFWEFLRVIERAASYVYCACMNACPMSHVSSSELAMLCVVGFLCSISYSRSSSWYLRLFPMFLATYDLPSNEYVSHSLCVFIILCVLIIQLVLW